MNNQIGLDKNEYVYPHSDMVLNYLKHIPPSILSTYAFGVDSLVKEITRLYKVPLESILLAHGGESLLKEALLSTLSAGDCILLPQGGWAYYNELAEETSAHIEFYPTLKSQGQFFYDIDWILNALKQKKPRVLLMASPNNPTGHVISLSDLKLVLDCSKTVGTYVILDEAYSGFSLNNLLWQEIQGYPRVLSVRSLSKFYGLAGLRIGYGFITTGWEVLHQRLYRYLGFSQLSSHIALEALQSHDFYLKNAFTIMEQRSFLEKELLHFGFEVATSHANFVFARLDSDSFSKAQKVFEASSIRIKFFDAHKEPFFESCIRITVGLPEHNREIIQLFQGIMG